MPLWANTLTDSATIVAIVKIFFISIAIVYQTVFGPFYGTIDSLSCKIGAKMAIFFELCKRQGHYAVK